MNLRKIKSKQVRDSTILEFLHGDSYLSKAIQRIENVNPFSYKLVQREALCHCMLYTSTLKVYDSTDVNGTFMFNTLQELKTYLISREVGIHG